MEGLLENLQKIEPYFLKESTIDININPSGTVFIKDYKTGKQKTNIVFTESERNIIARLLSTKNEKLINERNRSASGIYEFEKDKKRIKSRVQILIPPVVEGTTICFRMAKEKSLTLEDYLSHGLIEEKTYNYLINVVENKKNVIIAGATGSGKTTLLNALVGKIGETERVQIIEDTAEVMCNIPNVLKILTDNNYTYRDAVKDAMRCSPERIIVGEVRDGAALDLLKAWNTGHSGGFATIHANSAESVPERLIQLCQEVVVNASMELVAEAVNLIIFVEMKNGKVLLREILAPIGVMNKEILMKRVNM